MPIHHCEPTVDLTIEKIHPGAADEVADKCVGGKVEEGLRRVHLDHLALVHDHHRVGEGQGLGLIVGHVDQRQAAFPVNLLELAAERVLAMGIDDGQGLVEEDGRDIGAHQPASHGDLLPDIGCQGPGPLLETGNEIQHLCHLADPASDRRFIDPAVAQWKGEIVVHGQGVVDHRELKDLSDVSLLGGEFRHVPVVEENAALGRPQQTGNDVEQGRLTASRWSQKGVGLPVFPDMIHGFQGEVLGLVGPLLIRVGQPGELDACHALQTAPPAVS